MTIDIEEIDELYKKLNDQRHYYLTLLEEKDKEIYELKIELYNFKNNKKEVNKMTKEIYDVLMRMKEALIHNNSVTLTKKDLHFILKYINDLEKELVGENE